MSVRCLASLQPAIVKRIARGQSSRAESYGRARSSFMGAGPPPTLRTRTWLPRPSRPGNELAVKSLHPAITRTPRMRSPMETTLRMAA